MEPKMLRKSKILDLLQELNHKQRRLEYESHQPYQGSYNEGLIIGKLRMTRDLINDIRRVLDET